MSIIYLFLDEDQKNMSDDERWSKFWDYSSDKPFGKASQINIMNLSASEHEQVMDKLIRLIPVIKGRTGYDLDIDTMVSDGMDFILYDIIVKVK